MTNQSVAKLVADLSAGLDRPCSVCLEREGTVHLMIPHEKAGNFLNWTCCERCAAPYVEFVIDQGGQSG